MSAYNDRLDADIERADRRIADTGDRVAAHLRRSPVTGRASSPNGAITVTAGPGGRLVELNIESSALTMKPEALAAELVALAQRATRDADARLRHSIRSVVRPEVSGSLAELGVAPGAPAAEVGDDGDDGDDVDWAEVIRRTR